jgi:glycosyltransferase involved in cell wall biosynthesis
LGSNNNIVIVSPDNWSFIPVSKHHYAIELAKKHNVFFVNPPNNIQKDFQEKGVFIINQYKKVKGLRYLPSSIRKKLMNIEVKSILKKIPNNQIDIIWSFDTSRLYYLDLFNAKVKIAHIMDYTEHFNFKELTISADICLGVADCITDKMKLYNNNTFKINHGYFFSKNNIEQKTFKRITGVYIGNLNMEYIDWKLISLLAKSKPDIDFHFYGPLSVEKSKLNDNFKRIHNINNIKIFDPITPEEVKHRLTNASFCFVMYRHKEFGRQLDNSHKIMQYLGSGTPIFSSFTYDYRNENLFPMYYDELDLISKFEMFLENKLNDFTEEARQKRINYALDNTYPKQIDRIFEIIKSTL